MPFFVWKGELSARAIPASGSAVRSRKRFFFPLSAPVVSAWDPGRSRAQAAHPRRRLCSMHPAGGAAPPFGARLTAAALPAPLPGRPLRPRWEAGGRGPSRQPQLQPVFVASSRLPARPRLAAPGFTQRWRVRSSEGCTHLQRPGLLARRAPAPAGCREQRRKRTGPSSSCCSEPRVWGEGKPASSGSGSAASGRGWDAASRALALRTSRSSWRRADSGMESRAPGVALEHRSRGAAPVSPVPVSRDGSRGSRGRSLALPSTLP